MDYIYSIIEKSKFIKKYIYPNHWISGSSTMVYPISIFTMIKTDLSLVQYK